MQELHRPFGHRLGRAISAYVANYPDQRGGVDHRTPLADQIEMRLLPKLRGIDVEASRVPLDSLCRLVDEKLGDDALAAAIKASIQSAELGTGQFSWLGTTRK